MILLYMLIAIAILAVISMKAGNSDNEALWIFGIFGMALSILGIILLLFISYAYIAAGHKAEFLNKEYGTSYTREDIFFAEDVIDSVRELKRERIELNGSLLRENVGAGE